MHPELAALAKTKLDALMTNPGPHAGRLDQRSVVDRSSQVRAEAILASGDGWSSDDWFHAALVYQHASSALEIQRAHELAMMAVATAPIHPKARWLAAVTEDRLRMSRGEAQRFGTQFHCVDGTWDLYDVDPAVTDDERALWGMPPLAHAQKRAAGIDARMKRRSSRPAARAA